MSEPEIERRLHAAFTARADAVRPESLAVRATDSANALHPAGAGGSEHRVRRHAVRSKKLESHAWGDRNRWAAPVAAALLLIAVLGVVFVRASPRPAPAPRPAALEGVAFDVPARWTYRPLAEGIGCLRPPGVPIVDGVCVPTGVQIQVGEFVGWPAGALDLDQGWSGASPDCRVAGLPSADPAAQRLTTREKRLIGDRVGDYRVWRVRCPGAPEFTARVWWRADISLTVFTVRLAARDDETVDAFVAGLRTTGK